MGLLSALFAGKSSACLLKSMSLIVGLMDWPNDHRLFLSRKWIDPGCFTLLPAVLGTFIVGSCGCFGSDETLACFIAGNVLNWDGHYSAELQARHDSFNSSLETLLNYATFGYLGAVMPWNEFQMPETTGITIPRLLGLGALVLIFRRIPAIMAGYRFMSEICSDWTEALFMGHFGPIGW